MRAPEPVLQSRGTALFGAKRIRWLLASLAGAPLDWEDVELTLASSNAGHLSYMPNRARPTALTASAGPLTSTCAAR